MIDRQTRGVHQRQIDLVKVQPKTSHTTRYGVQGLLISIPLSGKIPGFCRATVPRAGHLLRQSHATSYVARIRTRLSSIRGVLLAGLMAWRGMARPRSSRLVSSRGKGLVVVTFIHDLHCKSNLVEPSLTMIQICYYACRYVDEVRATEHFHLLSAIKVSVRMPNPAICFPFSSP